MFPFATRITNIKMFMSMKTTVGQRVKVLRTHLNLNPQQFAGDTNMTVSTLYRIEGDEVEPRSKTIGRYSTAGTYSTL